MDKYVSGRQRKLQVGLSSYSEGTQVVEVIGRVGIGSTVFGAQYDLDVRGNTNLGSSSSNLINIPGRISSSLHPSSDDVYDIGRQQQGVEVKRWKDAHFSGKGTFNAGVSAHDIEIGVGVGAANLIYSTSGNLKLNSNSGITEIDDNVTISGNTGIGTTNPTSKLWVEGDGYFAGVVTASNFYVGNNVVGSGGSLSTLYVSGISTFANGPLLLGGNLGIGTTNPTSKLWVEGDGYFAGVVTASNFYVNDSLVGVKISLGELYVGGISTFATGPVLIGYGSSGGNLGIGTTNPTSRLWVNGNSYFSGIITAGNIDALDINVRNINASGIVTVTNGPVLIGGGTSTGTAGQVLQVAGGSYVSGSVGIGTTNPTTALQVNGTTKVETSIGSTQSIWYTTLDSKGYSATNVDLLVQPETAYSFDASQTTSRFYEPTIFSHALTSANGSYNSRLYSFQNETNVAGTASNARIDGIGFWNSVYRNSTTDISSYASNTLLGIQNLTIQATNVDQSAVTGFAYGITNLVGIQKATATNIYGSFTQTNIGTLANYSASSTNAYGSYNLMQVGAASGTGIGTITNYYGYYVAPTVALTGKLTNYYGLYLATPIVSGTLTNRYSIYSSDASSPMYHAGSVGIGTTNPTSALTVTGDTYISGILTATDINSASDIKLKTNIKPFENTLEKIVQINGVSFNWIENNAKSGGIIAQDVEKVFPELVNDGDHKTVNYNGLIGVLVESIKELKQEIEDLKSRFNCT